jgi:fructose-1,6-bisphosphatase/inositol monophosphatase family enzyme
MLEDPKSIIDRLIEFQSGVRKLLIDSRGHASLHAVDRDAEADTIYRIDAVVEPVIEEFCREWSKSTPLVLIAEGMRDEAGHEGPRTFPAGCALDRCPIRVIIDPIDGTRGIMYDKRSAWALAGVAPNRGDATRLSDIEVAVMTELPTSKMGLADVLWATKAGGARGRRVDLSSGATQPLALHPSQADGIEHGFAMIASFFPGTKRLAGELMDQLAAEVVQSAEKSRSAGAAAIVFDDQYISTGGQFYELIVGHDRFNADLRPLLYRILGQPGGLATHPYDCATALIATEAGVILTDALGGPLDGPLDTTSPITWAGFANDKLRARIEPVLKRLLLGLAAGGHGR